MDLKPAHKTSELAYGHAGHEAFNAQLKARGHLPAGDWITAPWLSHDKVPDVLNAFEMSRDPMIEAQRLDMEKSEAVRRREQSGRGDAGSNGGHSAQHSRKQGSRMVGADSSKPALTPPRDIRGPIDRQNFNNRWMVEERDAALARADLKASLPEQAHNYHMRTIHTPSR